MRICNTTGALGDSDWSGAVSGDQALPQVQRSSAANGRCHDAIHRAAQGRQRRGRCHPPSHGQGDWTLQACVFGSCLDFDSSASALITFSQVYLQSPTPERPSNIHREQVSIFLLGDTVLVSDNERSYSAGVSLRAQACALSVTCCASFLYLNIAVHRAQPYWHCGGDQQPHHVRWQQTEAEWSEISGLLTRRCNCGSGMYKFGVLARATYSVTDEHRCACFATLIGL